MRVYVSCSWCHEVNDARREYCLACGHELAASRATCRCPVCLMAARKQAERAS